ncbi:hypothetical protein HanRHA438_Chr05g0213821 [Helianthus annuus]|uniref:Uncharacterized protein n=1 Tax=Helianthus annuus TaxID=4232 RepID=A0A9K3IXF4_HELAN|nr:hypothetical protein HanXRQr2_Chr05g0203951 [Helianthus annuus]KAJ0569550.1 hypothetical protein HanHA300_Chr05g0167481 [Helianthus annuus]KAJ0583861.1 hypothetical protein HanHA89_Chr05g0181551 [Helianthus annuus]KAJ0918109.1 hypothetical protein HanRHA438_Chr05g0213821 [Helianthus annuus]KAJ0921874.1 hypothetical protein HanPSC8_Chr05g0196791 [Helianthus annuus]
METAPNSGIGKTNGRKDIADLEEVVGHFSFNSVQDSWWGGDMRGLLFCEVGETCVGGGSVWEGQ